jgi:hypothetical protein
MTLTARHHSMPCGTVDLLRVAKFPLAITVSGIARSAELAEFTEFPAISSERVSWLIASFQICFVQLLARSPPFFPLVGSGSN